MNKEVTTRKDHICEYCMRIIPAKSIMTIYQGRLPVYGTDKSHGDIYGESDQVGIEYYRGYTCFEDPKCRTKDDLEAEKECKKNGHSFMEEEIPVSIYPEDGTVKTGNFYCNNCNLKRI